MMKRGLILALALCLALSGAAFAQTGSFSDDMKQWGEELGEWAGAFGQGAGEKLSDFGEQLRQFSQDPEAYLDETGLLDEIRDKAQQAGKSLQEYWPTFKASVQGSVDTILGSDLSWEQKRDQLKRYGELAIPYLAELDFDKMGEGAKAAMEALKEMLNMNEEQVKQWLEDNGQKLGELKVSTE